MGHKSEILESEAGTCKQERGVDRDRKVIYKVGFESDQNVLYTYKNVIKDKFSQ